MRKHLLLAAKTAWTIAMVGVLVWFVVTHRAEFAAYVGRVGGLSIVVSIVLLLIAKILLALVGQQALAAFGWRLGFMNLFYAYAISQMGKYLPGSVWQYAGRVMLYRAEGVPAKEGGKAILLESFWLLGSATTLGAAVSMPRLVEIAGLSGTQWILFDTLLSALFLLGMPLSLLVGSRLLINYFGGVTPSIVGVTLLEIGIWVVLGVSFWVIFPPEARGMETLLVAIGAFALGWVGGYLAIFAPAGVGVREAIIVALVANVMSLPVAVAVVSLARLLYSFTDIALGALAALCYKPPITNDTTTASAISDQN